VIPLIKHLDDRRADTNRNNRRGGKASNHRNGSVTPGSGRYLRA
jgi:hypothetical protein